MKNNKASKMYISIAAFVIMTLIGGAVWYYYRNLGDETNSESSAMVAQKIVADSNDDIDWATLPTTNVILTDDDYMVTSAGTYVLSGNTTGSVSVNSDGYIRLVLDGVNIKSSDNAAIYIENAKKTVIQLADGSMNTVADAGARSDKNIDGAIYSSDDLVVNGTGTLDVTANFADGIVSKDELWVTSGNITVNSVDDGIRGKDSLNVNGGTIVIDAKGDGMKASNDTDLGKGQLLITDGDITISSGDDAIKAEQKISITGGTINIKTSVEGIEAPVIVIDGGNITLYASDDGINASASAIITSGLSVTINDGNLNITVGGGDTDAIDSNGDLYVNGGIVIITAQTSSFDFDGSGAINGGTVTVNGQKITEMPTQMMGGAPGGMKR